MELETHEHRSVVRDGPEEGAAAHAGECNLSLTGGGEKDMIYQGFRRGPLIVREERLGAVAGGLCNRGQERRRRCPAAQSFQWAVVIRPGGIKVTSHYGDGGTSRGAPAAVSKRFESDQIR